MKKLIFISLLIFLLSCSKDFLFEEPVYIFPLSLGNEWEYERVWIINAPGIIVDTFNFTVKWEIIDKFSILNYKAFTMRESVNGYINYVFYSNKEDGFYMIGYYNPTLFSFNIPESLKYSIRFGDRIFPSLKDLLNFLYNSFLLSIQDTYINIRKCFPYPPVIGEKWIFFTEPFYAERTIKNKEIISVKAGTFETFRVETYYDLDGNGKIYDDFLWIDFFSGEGIIKRYFWIIFEVIDENGRIIGKGESKDFYLLSKRRLKNE